MTTWNELEKAKYASRVLRQPQQADPSVMDGYAPPQQPTGYVNTEPPLEAPMFSPDDLLGTGVGKAALAGGASVASLLRLMGKGGVPSRFRQSGAVGKGSEKLFAEPVELPGYKSRYATVNMPLDDFLTTAEKLGNPDVEKLKEVNRLLDAGIPFETRPFLQMDNPRGDPTSVVTGHEGRHRAMALKERGYTHMPVELRGDIRWSEQVDPNRFDYRDDWPVELQGQQGIRKPFPLQRNQISDLLPEVWAEELRKAK